MKKLYGYSMPGYTKETRNNYRRWKRQYLASQRNRKGFLSWLWNTVWNYAA
ncbi:MAG: hypothetical protein HQL05_03790 [Nitrospirae bacterium]|uniref:hypothetical protein n=1 Tax=Candidatus Magnetobacterium casense TaxID=1455061 RepID=UPI0012DDB958|nr:hypothetical protein [Candidatus Magnetobacterium casensis]MBF0336931.1 hypothetical protein [Nitrospirota bacterium]